jgi:two-component system, chemotaxis family, CheB/CheR fusion protein
MPEPQGTSTRLKRPSQPLWNGHSYADAIVQTVRQPLLVLDKDLRVESANRSFYETFRVSPEETEGRLIYELGDRQWDIPKLREFLEEILPQDGQFQNFEVEHDFPAIGRKAMLLNARRLRQEGTGAELILLAVEDITERKQAEEDLRNLKDALEKRVAELDAFAYSVSHDLKEPLRAVEAFGRFVLEDYGDRLDDQGQEYLKRLAAASVRMQRLIDDLLTLTRASRHSRPDRVDVGRLVREVAEWMRPQIEGQSATVEVEGGLPEVAADSTQVEQIFRNLIGNGLKFNQSGRPLVKVGFKGKEGRMGIFYVRDNGIGIEPQYHERIFGMFQRLHRREEYDGTGAGLAIVKRVVEYLGGRIWVESEVGAGATFFVALPLWRKGAVSRKREAA